MQELSDKVCGDCRFFKPLWAGKEGASQDGICYGDPIKPMRKKNDLACIHEDVFIKKLDAHLGSFAGELKKFSARLEKAEGRLCYAADHYVDLEWLEKVLAKLHPEIKEDNWYNDI